MKFFFEGMQAVGAGYQDIVYFSKPMVSRHGFLTANNNVPYVAVCLNTNRGLAQIKDHRPELHLRRAPQ